MYVPIVMILNTLIGRVNATQTTIGKSLWIELIWFQCQKRLSAKELDSYSVATNIAEEALGGIRTVYAFGGEQSEIERYNKGLIKAKYAVKLKGLLTGIGYGFMHFLFFACSALTFWYGVQLVLEDRDKIDKEYTLAVLMIVR